MDGLAILVIIIIVAIAVAAISHRNKVLRKKYLTEKYGLEIAEKVIGKRVWQGMTATQLIESWGQPEDRDEKIYKTKTKEIWKYGNVGKNRFRQRVYVENGYVVGWQNQ